MAFEGKTFLTTMGHHPQYWHFEGSGQSRNPYHMFDLTADTKAESRSRALASSGTSLWRGQRILQLSGAEDVYTYYSFPNALIGDDLSGLMDALPWPDWSTVGGLYTTGDGPLEWSPNTIEPYDLYGYEIHAGGEWIAGGWFLYCDDMNVASQLGPSRPTADLSVEYGSGYLSDKTVMETASFVLGERGVAVSMWQYTAGSASPDIERFIADGTSYLAFGNMEGLLSTEMRQGVVGFEVRVPLPAYSHPAPAVRLGDTSEGWSGEYYGGHYTAIFTDTDEYLVMQVSGAPRGLSGTAPQPYAPRVGGVFDAFYLRGRPLPYKNF